MTRQIKHLRHSKFGVPFLAGRGIYERDPRFPLSGKRQLARASRKDFVKYDVQYRNPETNEMIGRFVVNTKDEAIQAADDINPFPLAKRIVKEF